MTGANHIATRPALPAIRWYNSLYFRVMVLCGVLLLCLLGSVVVITRVYFEEAVDEMERAARSLPDRVSIDFEQNPEQFSEAFTEASARIHPNAYVEFEPYIDTKFEGSVSIERGLEGEMRRVARVPLVLGGEWTVMTLSVPIEPQVEILRAFTNRNMLALTGVFLVALGLMVYFIARTLRPLKDLSDSCAAVSSGELKPVRVGTGTGEIRVLEGMFNQMVHSLREKELVEAKLRQAQRLSALGNLAAGVAHDVRNPLNAIKLLSSHALDSLNGGDATATKSLETIRREVSRLESIVSSFLSLARESELHPEPQRVDSLLDACINLIQQDAGQRDVRLSAELRAGDTIIDLDPKQMTRAVLNVLLNALEACGPGGRVRLFSRVSVDGCEIEIRDDGPGLDREELERVFEPYYTTKPGGTGLGLSLTRGIVEEHGGRVEMTSMPGQGCQVLITLPRTQEAAT
jgi:signal transduction histidine kinase